ncbi:DUF4435 domain-containing protein [Citrobacter werkmanii]|uniref:DUF4435 domain-containing protein n=1 Tax=Citrobacter werkmanii TaxID=67827 RepID=UPI0028848331|nr:DUF4435 domain-containing protein [Citrobacter werkmanii]MDT0639861.1 DUF4435 domain-containing protein [Citrobacter werkmanii]
MDEFESIMKGFAYQRARLQFEGKGHKALLYIEDAGDRLFWEGITNAVHPGFFDVKPFTQTGSEGKRRLEKEYPKVNPAYMVAVDSDFDYLCPQRSPLAATMNASPYILHTFIYSLESHICCREALTDIDNRIRLNIPVPVASISKVVQEYSSLIYKALCLFAFIHNSSPENCPEHEFREAVKFPAGHHITDDGNSISPSAKAALNTKLDIFIQNYNSQIQNQNEYSDFCQSLREKDITENTAFMFINGHDLYNSIVSLAFKKCTNLNRIADEHWVDSEVPQEQIQSRKNQVKNYYRDNCNVGTLFFQGTVHMTSLFCQKITEKLNLAIAHQTI